MLFPRMRYYSLSCSNLGIIQSIVSGAWYDNRHLKHRTGIYSGDSAISLGSPFRRWKMSRMKLTVLIHWTCLFALEDEHVLVKILRFYIGNKEISSLRFKMVRLNWTWLYNFNKLFFVWIYLFLWSEIWRAQLILCFTGEFPQLYFISLQ